MKIGIVGLGRMGAAIAYRLRKANIAVVGFDPNAQACREAAQDGVEIINDLAQMPQQVRIIWLMVPAGAIVDSTIAALQPHMQAGDILVDGGNSNFLDSVRRAEALKNKNIIYLDVGTSGGLAGREQGFSLMIGGERAAYEKLEKVFTALAAPEGYGYMGPSGAGHYVKMIHNGIEYALLQSYAEGFDLLKHGTYKDLDLEEIARVWQHGSVIRSWLLELMHNVFEQTKSIDAVSGKIGGGSTGRWTLEDAHRNKVPCAMLEQAMKIREQSQITGGDYATKLVALLRHQFGGHSVESIKTNK